jgi:hypothetical protein
MGIPKRFSDRSVENDPGGRLGRPGISSLCGRIRRVRV